MGKRKAAMLSEPEPEVKKICHEAQGQPSDGQKTEAKQKKIYSEKSLLKRERQKASMQRPKVFLTMANLGLECTTSGHSPAEKDESVGEENKQTTGENDKETTGDKDKVSADEKPQLFIRDLQYLLIYALRRGLNYPQPRWCCMLRPGKMTSAVLVVLNDVSATDFQQHKDCFSFLDGTFNKNLRAVMTNPGQYFSSFDFDMYAVPLSESQLRGFTRKHGNHHYRNGRQILFPSPANTPDYKNTENNKTSPEAKTEKNKQANPEGVRRRQVLLSVQQMAEENYPLPDEKEKLGDFVMSKEKYAPVTSDSPMFAVDCEMCLTSALKHELTRVSVISEKNEVLYDELVKPYNAIINYLTRYSGITKQMLDPVTKRIEDVQKDLRDLLPDDAILCGHSLGNDLTALKIFHPYVVDTSVLYNLSGNRKMKCSLKRLTYCFLGRAIQESRKGHNSAEDATATMDLIRLKLSKSMEFGDAVLGGDVAPYLQSVLTSYKSTTQDDKPGTRSKEENVPDVVMMRSLFDYLSYMRVSACQVGGEKLVTKYQEEPDLKCCQTESDQKSRKMAAELCQKTKFTWVEFSAFRDLLTSQDQTDKEDAGEEPSETEADMKKKRKVLKKLDKQIMKLMEQVPEKSLVTVVLAGRSSREQHEHAAAFLHIT